MLWVQATDMQVGHLAPLVPCLLENVMWQRVIAPKTRLGELTVIVCQFGSLTFRPIRRVYKYGPVLVEAVLMGGFSLAVCRPTMLPFQTDK